MKKQIAALCLLAVTGCGATSGFLPGNVTQVQISKSGFNLVKTNITGRADELSLLCIVPLGDGELYKIAMLHLTYNAALKPNQMFINIREDTQTRTYIFACTHVLTLSADVIEFTDTIVTAPKKPLMPKLVGTVIQTSIVDTPETETTPFGGRR